MISLCSVRQKSKKAGNAALNETASETEGEAGDVSLIVSPKGSTERFNAMGMRINSNNVVSFIANQFPSKTRDEYSLKCFNTTPTLSKAYTLFTLIVNVAKCQLRSRGTVQCG
jgi:hypothetical protein